MKASISISLLGWLLSFGAASAQSNDAPPQVSRIQTTMATIPQAPPAGAARPVLPDYISFSLEFSSFPSYAGTGAVPNALTRRLLDTIAKAQGGAYPVIRVGGESQDRALLTGYMDTPFNYSYNPRATDDYLPYGKMFYDSYLAFPRNTRFIHGLNLAKSEGDYMRVLRSALVMLCEEVGGRIAPVTWELGNEPDAYGAQTTINPRGQRQVVRSGAWDEGAFVRDWVSVERQLRRELAYSCPQMTADAMWRFAGPSFSGRGDGGMDPLRVWEGGLKQERVITEFSSHFYAGDAKGAQQEDPKRAIADHAYLKSAFQPHIQASRQMAASGVPFVLGETNFARRQSILGVTDTFASALWTLDMALYAASQGVSRIQLHQAVDSAGSAWQPLDTPQNRQEVKPAFYGALAAANMVARGARIVELDANDDAKPVVTYAAFEGDRLRRIMLINMKQAQIEHAIVVPQTDCGARAFVSRLAAPAATSADFVSWAGMYFAPDGTPRYLERAGQEFVDKDQSGALKVTMPGAGAVMLDLVC